MLVFSAFACRRDAPGREEVVADPATHASTTASQPASMVELTWIVDDRSTDEEIRMARELVVRVAGGVRRFPVGITNAGCGLFPDRPVIANPIPVGAEVTRLRCWNGGGDDLVVMRASADAVAVYQESSSDGLGAPPPVVVPIVASVSVPQDAVFADRVTFLDHGAPVGDDP